MIVVALMGLWWLSSSGGPQQVNPPTQQQVTSVVHTSPPPSVARTSLPSTPNTQTAACGSGSYVNVDGNCISGPVYAPSVPVGASARCRDGTYSFSQHRQGTCSHHGGVASWNP